MGVKGFVDLCILLRMGLECIILFVWSFFDYGSLILML